jgi:thioredoxin reductase (NADPH)
MTDATPSVPQPLTAALDRLFPTLTSAQIARIAAHGDRRQVQRGEVLVEAGENPRFFVVTAGNIEIVRPARGTEEVVAVCGPGQFTGEVNMLSGRRGFLRVRASASGEVIAVERERLLALVQADSQLSDNLMRTFILRRVELISR